MPLSVALLDHFKNPRNVGRVAAPTGRGVAENPLCGDHIEIEVRLDQEQIVAIAFMAQGCSATLACGSFLTDRAMGASRDVALALDADRLLEETLESSAVRRHGMQLALTALKAALTSSAPLA